MKKIILLFISIALLLSPSLVFGRNAVDVIFYHYRTTPHDNSASQEKTIHFPLFPQEQAIAHFPEPVAKNETDLAVLQRYYEDVAKAYQNYLNDGLKAKVENYRLKMADQQQKIDLTQTRHRTGKNQFARHLTDGKGETTGQDRIEHKARIQAIGYYNKAYRDLSERLVRTEKQALFYQELAQISEELYKGEIH